MRSLASLLVRCLFIPQIAIVCAHPDHAAERSISALDRAPSSAGTISNLLSAPAPLKVRRSLEARGIGGLTDAQWELLHQGWYQIIDMRLGACVLMQRIEFQNGLSLDKTNRVWTDEELQLLFQGWIENCDKEIQKEQAEHPDLDEIWEPEGKEHERYWTTSEDVEKGRERLAKGETSDAQRRRLEELRRKLAEGWNEDEGRGGGDGKSFSITGIQNSVRERVKEMRNNAFNNVGHVLNQIQGGPGGSFGGKAPVGRLPAGISPVKASVLWRL